MTRFACFLLVLATAPLFAQNDIQRGKIKKIDLDKMTITLTVGDKDREFALTDETRIGAEGKNVKERLERFKEGTAVQFLARQRGGKDVLVGIRLADGGNAAGGRPVQKVDSSKFKPLTELGKEEYQGFAGGLYPDGKNERPAAHEAAGIALAKQVRPLDADGKPSDNGKIILLSIGMSNTTQEFSTFKRIADRDSGKNPKLTIVDGAVGGMTAARIANPKADYWAAVDQRLKAAGVGREQVQVAWIKEADAQPNQGFPTYARTLQSELKQIVQLMHERFPNLKLVYLSSRTYGGYATTALNPEPYAYESGFSVKWLIEEQLKGEAALNFDPKKGEVKAPWLSWGPYLWANGTTKRADGFMYEQSDFGGDGTHPSESGRRKVADLLLQFFKSDSTAKMWFTRGE